MELQTKVIDGIEYVLVPKTLVSDQPPPQPQAQARTIGLEGFLPAETVVDTSSGPVIEKEEEKPLTVDPSFLVGIAKAEGKPSAYREKFLTHSLMPGDVMTFPTVGHSLKQFEEIKEIRAADFGNRIPPGKWGFYGPGIEGDVLV